MTKATHNGTCQACGAQQAVNPKTGNLAQHGYTVDWGYFNGVCHGSGRQPLEHSRWQLDRWHKQMAERAEMLRSKTLDDIDHVIIREHVRGRPLEFKTHVVKSEEELQQFRLARIETRSWEQLRKARLADMNREARMLDEHVTHMEAVADQRHGQELLDREQIERERKEEKAARRTARTQAAVKEDIRKIAREYEHGRREVMDRILKPFHENGEPLSSDYDVLPFELHQYTTKRETEYRAVFERWAPELLQRLDQIAAARKILAAELKAIRQDRAA